VRIGKEDVNLDGASVFPCRGAGHNVVGVSLDIYPVRLGGTVRRESDCTQPFRGIRCRSPIRKVVGQGCLSFLVRYSIYPTSDESVIQLIPGQCCGHRSPNEDRADRYKPKEIVAP